MLRGAFPCGLLRTVCVCCNPLFGVTVCVGMEGSGVTSWRGAGFVGEGGGGVGFGDFMADGVLAGP